MANLSIMGEFSLQKNNNVLSLMIQGRMWFGFLLFISERRKVILIYEKEMLKGDRMKLQWKHKTDSH